ncbi:hypothetical protein [Sphingobacterium luzhongxinii]|uniref:hypothetical protein n=1 Tax=Sphingobacterium luzhongxinii TaxID=2654181 RepID=UPI001F09D770|nr:hypothetical protein [Sphingobacterium sp. xlx-73]
MNLIFYMSIQRIPLGLAVTVEFVGPLFLSLSLSRKLLDTAWALLACIGILLIVPWTNSDVDLIGSGISFISRYVLGHVYRRGKQSIESHGG